ncbi:unnamed protein product [Adineta ricciae]|uniref:Uncharacterized protein n=1 Tax=Adineta ricciae TaxID=249248 RepID=A0A814BTR1_ADIRI|nr:unnamed protein product [Adineta ricciae]CAF1498048.1 unnamed protein product [Adineta ricciae]
MASLLLNLSLYQPTLKCRQCSYVKTIVPHRYDADNPNELPWPVGLYMGPYDQIFIVDKMRDRVLLMAAQEDVYSNAIAGDTENSKTYDRLFCPTSVYYEEENYSLIIADAGNRRIIRWLFTEGSIRRRFKTWWKKTQCETLIEDIDCFGIAVDDRGFLYVVDSVKGQVTRWPLRGVSGLLKLGVHGKVVAGGNGCGNCSDQLNNPSYIVVDQDYSIIISDTGNHRIMIWFEGFSSGKTLAGGRGRGNKLDQLSSPQGITFDNFGRVYIADAGNSRVVRWTPGATEGEILVDSSASKDEFNQVTDPRDFAWDTEGHLYVADAKIGRILKFKIDDS